MSAKPWKVLNAVLLLLILSVAPLTVQAMPMQSQSSTLETGNDGQGSLLSNLWQLWVSFKSLVAGAGTDADLGPALDPNGVSSDLGPALDPNGLTTDLGPALDPNGVNTDLGPALDPNG